MAYFPLICHGPYIKRRFQKFFYCCVCIRCRGNVFAEPLPNNVQTDWCKGFIEYVVEMGSGVMIYIPSFIKIGLGIRKLIGGYTDWISQAYFKFLKIRKVC
jgi:hypothetical protein